ncbi:MAG: hypothetical protein ABS81_02470 [Pseudonocardia sp. SCN 72-86]|nr:MAG: hypothetical protein ABS81_02470 [Pseudonocardia sp. SCN 72-86]
MTSGVGAYRRNRIVTQSARLFDQVGYFQTSMADIARSSGVKKPTLYHYFRSKDQILFVILDEIIDVLLTQQSLPERQDLSGPDALLALITDIITLLDTHPSYVRAAFEHYRDLPPELGQVIQKKRDTYVEGIETLISKAADAGELSPEYPRVSALAVFGMATWAYSWYRSDGPLNAEQLARRLWTIFLRGVETRHPEDESGPTVP